MPLLHPMDLDPLRPELRSQLRPLPAGELRAGEDAVGLDREQPARVHRPGRHNRLFGLHPPVRLLQRGLRRIRRAEDLPECGPGSGVHGKSWAHPSIHLPPLAHSLTVPGGAGPVRADHGALALLQGRRGQDQELPRGPHHLDHQ